MFLFAEIPPVLDFPCVYYVLQYLGFLGEWGENDLFYGLNCRTPSV